jgi:hypothetical protein
MFEDEGKAASLKDFDHSTHISNCVDLRDISASSAMNTGHGRELTAVRFDHSGILSLPSKRSSPNVGLNLTEGVYAPSRDRPAHGVDGSHTRQA